jgi:hypothetical protein
MPQVVSLTYQNRDARRDIETSWYRMIADIRTAAVEIRNVSVLLSDGETGADAITEIETFCLAKGAKIEKVHSAEFFFLNQTPVALSESELTGINFLLVKRVSEHVSANTKYAAYLEGVDAHLSRILPDRVRPEKNMNDMLADLAFTLDVVSTNIADSVSTGNSIPLYGYDPHPIAATHRDVDDQIRRWAYWKKSLPLVGELPGDMQLAISVVLKAQIYEAKLLPDIDEYIARQQDREEAYDLYMQSASRQMSEAWESYRSIYTGVLSEVDAAVFRDDWMSDAEDLVRDKTLTGARTRLAQYFSVRKQARDTFLGIQKTMRMVIVALSVLYDDYQSDTERVIEAIDSLNNGLPIRITKADLDTAEIDIAADVKRMTDEINLENAAVAAKADADEKQRIAAVKAELARVNALDANIKAAEADRESRMNPLSFAPPPPPPPKKKKKTPPPPPPSSSSSSSTSSAPSKTTPPTTTPPTTTPPTTAPPTTAPPTTTPPTTTPPTTTPPTTTPPTTTPPTTTPPTTAPSTTTPPTTTPPPVTSSSSSSSAPPTTTAPTTTAPPTASSSTAKGKAPAAASSYASALGAGPTPTSFRQAGGNPTTLRKTPSTKGSVSGDPTDAINEDDY